MKYPRKFQIGFQEGTCPLSCKKCFAFGEGVDRKKAVEKMPMDKAKKLLDEIAELESHATIQPHIYTEPFANPDLKQIIQYCGYKELRMSIITNGVMLNKEWIDFLVNQTNQDITISFSLDAVKQETYEKVRGDYVLADIEKNIIYLVQNRKNRRLSIGVNFTAEDDNRSEKEDFLNKWKYQVDAVRLHEVIDKNRRALQSVQKATGFNECENLNEVMVIDAGGEVRACSLDAFGDSYLGNIFEESIDSIWNGQAMEGLRKRIRQQMLVPEEFCYGCIACGYGGNYVQSEDDEFYIADNGYDVFYNHKE